MCEFLSAVKGKSKSGKDQWYFLTYDMIYNTPRGELLQKKFPGEDNQWGHAAIRDYFQLRTGEGQDWECTDFSNPANFPAILVKSIKRGDMRYGYLKFEQLLTPKALKEVKADADRQKADADWQKADADRQKADADRRKAYADRQKADADWQKADADWRKADADRRKADADWRKAYADRQKADADLQKAYADLQKADADWRKAYADWQKAYADWRKADADRRKAYADRQKAYAKISWELFSNPENRVEAWQD